MTRPFKVNFHVAKKMSLEKVEREIKNYPKQYPTPKYLLFMKKMLENGWSVKIHMVRISKYIFVFKDDEIFKIRFSNHKPLYGRELENDCDYYVGISNMQVSTTEEIIEKIIK